MIEIKESKKFDDNLFLMAAATLVVLMSHKSNTKYEPRIKTEKEKQIESYFNEEDCFYHEKSKTILMKRSTISLQELKDIAEILEVDNLTFDVSHDYDGCLESEIIWK